LTQEVKNKRGRRWHAYKEVVPKRRAVSNSPKEGMLSRAGDGGMDPLEGAASALKKEA